MSFSILSGRVYLSIAIMSRGVIDVGTNAGPVSQGGHGALYRWADIAAASFIWRHLASTNW